LAIAVGSRNCNDGRSTDPLDVGWPVDQEVAIVIDVRRHRENARFRGGDAVIQIGTVFGVSKVIPQVDDDRRPVAVIGPTAEGTTVIRHVQGSRRVVDGVDDNPQRRGYRSAIGVLGLDRILAVTEDVLG
jgi:hypothetical protein